MNKEKTKEDEFEVRRKKLEYLINIGEEPYKSKFKRTSQIEKIRKLYETISSGQETGKNARVAGRIIIFRRHGKASFVVIQDGTEKIQLYAAFNLLGENKYREFTALDIGDWIGVSGEIFKTRLGELSIKIKNFEILSKSLRPLPEKWHGLKDVELRHRKRYLDLMMNPAVKEIFYLRGRVIQEIRNFLTRKGFIEVDTPVFQSIPGGAIARPFKTYHQALDMNLYLRIAPELFLKRLIIGGFEKVFEIGKSFRNEGISTRHNPEFTMLELYEAYEDYDGIMELTQDLIQFVVKRIFKKLTLNYQNHKINFSGKWKRLTMLEAIKRYTNVKISFEMKISELKKIAMNLGVELEPQYGKGKIIEEIFEKKVEEHLIQPTFVMDYPKETSPLARTNPKNQELVERFELIIAGIEVANAFSELIDPLEQKKRFQSQITLAREREEEIEIDEDFIHALEYGMPPTGGLGIGIDRLVMLLSNSSSIREVILFPQLRGK